MKITPVTMPSVTPLPGDTPGTVGSNLFRARLSEACPDWTIEYVAETGSTNADLLHRFSDQSNNIKAQLRQLSGPLSWAEASTAFPPCARIAGTQTAGRGRMGRPWRSASGKSLLFSLGIVMPRSVGALSGLSLAVGLGVIDGLRTMPLSESARLGLKWPNDILLDDAKLGGILIETAASSAHACALVIGIGLNIDPPPSVASPMDTTIAAATDADQRKYANVANVANAASVAMPLPAAHLATLMPSVLRDAPRDALMSDVFAAMLPAVATVLKRFAAEGLAPFRDRWWDMHRFANRPVSIIDNGEAKLSGNAVGIDQYGRLLIDAAQDENPPALVTVTAGDVSLRLTNAS